MIRYTSCGTATDLLRGPGEVDEFLTERCDGGGVLPIRERCGDILGTAPELKETVREFLGGGVRKDQRIRRDRRASEVTTLLIGALTAGMPTIAAMPTTSRLNDLLTAPGAPRGCGGAPM